MECVRVMEAIAGDLAVTNTCDMGHFTDVMEEVFAKNGYRDFYRKSSKEKIRIMVLHDGGVGDFVNLSPILRELKRIYPNAELIMVLPPHSADLASVSPYVDFLLINEKCNKILNFYDSYCWDLEFAQKLLPLHVDISFNFGVFFSSALLCYMSGCVERILGISRKAWDMWNNNVSYDIATLLSTAVPLKWRRSNHIVDQYLAVIDNMFYTPVQNRELEIWCTESDVAFARNELQLKYEGMENRQWIALSMGGSTANKHWPPRNYAKLTEMILGSNPDFMIVIIGGETDIPSGEMVQELVPSDRVLNLTNQLSFCQVAACLSLCKYFIGNDTGAMHIAAALKIPVLEVSCYPMDIPQTDGSIEVYYPYHVPAVVVQPNAALPGCPGNHPLKASGCTASAPHCIAQVTVEEMWEGWCALQHDQWNAARHA